MTCHTPIWRSIDGASSADVLCLDRKRRGGCCIFFRDWRRGSTARAAHFVAAARRASQHTAAVMLARYGKVPPYIREYIPTTSAAASRPACMSILSRRTGSWCGRGCGQAGGAEEERQPCRLSGPCWTARSQLPLARCGRSKTKVMKGEPLPDLVRIYFSSGAECVGGVRAFLWLVRLQPKSGDAS
jgi:hypothetical protein